MANVAHSTLTGADLHEPKGVAAAASGTVYIADGGGSGAWGTIATALNFTGMIADFAVPVAPTGWLECDGSAVSRTTYADLFSSQTIQQSGTRTSGNPVITGLSSTANMQVGYFVGGSGITNGTTVLSVDSATQITLSDNATSSGTSTVIVGPWSLGDGSTTFNIPDVKTAGRFRRSRTSSVQVGTAQADQNKAHTHTGATGTESATHTHSGTTASGNASISQNALKLVGGAAYDNVGVGSLGNATITDLGHTHTFTTGTNSASHTHTISSDGGTEARPLGIVVMTCIKY